eukprot:527511-Rhodomonas_salina.1
MLLQLLYFAFSDMCAVRQVFSWEDAYQLRPGKPLVTWLRMIARETAATKYAAAYLLLVDNLPESSLLMLNYPEIRCYRDICFWWKYFLNPDRKVFPNHSEDDSLTMHKRIAARLTWGWKNDEGGYVVRSKLSGSALRCRPNPDMVRPRFSAFALAQVDPVTGRKLKADELPQHRFSSTATPSFYVPPPLLHTEDDVIYRPNLPSFEDASGAKTGGAVLSQRDSELLISFLTV